MALIEYRGQRAPLVVAAVGTGLAQLVIVVGGGWQHHWAVVSGSLLGTALAVVVYGLLRRGDPECADPRGHGRSALLPAGCWVGGLGLGAAAVGSAVWIVAYALCMVGAWSMAASWPGPGPTPERSDLGRSTRLCSWLPWSPPSPSGWPRPSSRGVDDDHGHP